MGKKKQKLKAAPEWDVDNVCEPQWDEGEQIQLKVWPTEGEKTALIDADLIPYIVGFCQSEEDWYKAIVSSNQQMLIAESDESFRFMMELSCCKSAIDHCNEMVNTWVRRAECDSAKLYLTAGRQQYRYSTAFSKEYKGNRGKPKPPFFSLIKWYLEKIHGAVVAYDNEADDLMAIEQFQCNEELVEEGAEQGSIMAKRFSRTVIVSKDKDLRMIPGWHSNPDVNKGEPFWVDEVGWLEPEWHPKTNKMTALKGAGMKFFYAQLLMGDAVDNYGGLPRVGMNQAYDYLEPLNKVKEMDKLVKNLYKRKYGKDKFDFKTWDGQIIEVNWKDMFVEQARLAWMQRHEGDIYMPKHKLPYTPVEEDDIPF
jgi:5'-3' exonuclease